MTTQTKTHKYYSLIGLDDETNRWGIIFGSYTKREAQDEMKIEKENDAEGYCSEFRIIETSDLQADIDAAVNQLNEEIEKDEEASYTIINGEPFKYFVVGPCCWGSGFSIEQAFKNCKANWPAIGNWKRKPKSVADDRVKVYLASACCYVSEWGAIYAEQRDDKKNATQVIEIKMK